MFDLVLEEDAILIGFAEAKLNLSVAFWEISGIAQWTVRLEDVSSPNGKI